MKKVGNWLIPVLVLGALGFIVLGVNQAGFSQDTPVPNPIPAQPKIGVVNMVKVFGEYKKTKEYEKLLENDKKKEELKIQEIEKEIKVLIDEIEALDRYSELRREKNERLAVLSAQREYRAKNWNNWIKNKVNKHTVTIYNEIREAVDKYGKDQGYICIFKADPELELEPEESASEKINMRAVLYYDQSINLTEEIIQVLNKE
ncbi:OmpH family outer membrane protein [Planctomycetota bacterium]